MIYSSLSDYKNKPFELAKQGDYGKIIEEELDPLAKGFQDTVKRTRGNKLDTKIEGILAGRMSVVELVRREEQLKNNIWRVTNEIKKGNKPHLDIERRAKLSGYEIELTEVQRLINE